MCGPSGVTGTPAARCTRRRSVLHSLIFRDYSLNPYGIIQFQSDKKYLILTRWVTRILWIEVAIWRTSASTLKGWKLDLLHRRLITPLVGIALQVYLGS